MMINKRLIRTVKESKKYIVGNVVSQWIALAANIIMMGAIAKMLQHLYEGTVGKEQFAFVGGLAAAAVAVRCVCAVISGRMSYLSSKEVKQTFRQLIYQKLLRLGSSYRERINTSEVVQVAVEGVDQLETYFGAYLPQFFYAMVAPLTLFAVLSVVNFPSAFILLICVPMIPVTIIVIQRWARKLLAKYWNQYTALGDTFLENLQGLTTTKIYQSDEFKHREMNAQSEQFRKITMKVLTMQLNSITIMDLIAYGGAAAGVILAVFQLRSGKVDLYGCIMIILLAAEFFLPMRLLGSYFHIAMNGMAASDKIFYLLDLAEPEQKNTSVSDDTSMICRDLHFSYETDREVLHGIHMKFPKGSFTAIVGESGCGKSTISSILMGRNKGYTGEITVGGIPLYEISERSLMENFTYISHQSYLFKGTVRENLQMAQSNAGDDLLWQVLEQVNLADFLRNENGLDTLLEENASNFSGGQRQRLALAKALLRNSPVYIFDEATSNIDVESENDIMTQATSNIDVESENDIMTQIYTLAKTKTVILISHRLVNVTGADNIYVLEQGKLVEEGAHQTLLSQNGIYAKLWNTQQELESYTKGGNAHAAKWI